MKQVRPGGLFSNSELSRRRFLRSTGAGLLGAGFMARRGLSRAAAAKPRLTLRGIVIAPADLTLEDWPERAAAARLTTIALHNKTQIEPFVRSDAGQRFLEKCAENYLEVEYEIHAMRDLLPRELFKKDPTMFRVNERGQRSPDTNFCAHSAAALEVIVENMLKVAAALKPTSGRYFFWGDDSDNRCRCPKCKELNGADLALIAENKMVQALRELNPNAELAHLAYAATIEAPRHIKPEPGVFLEYAPIHRKHHVKYESRANDQTRDPIRLLDANLKVFPVETAQILEYWFDSSHFPPGPDGKRPSRLRWNRELFAADVAAYARRGIRRFTSFGVNVNADYVKQHGEPPLAEYGETLAAFGS